MKIAKMISSTLLALLLLVGSCTPEKIDFNSNDSANVENETASDAYFSDTEDLASVTVSSDNATAGGRLGEGSRKIDVNDPRLVCATVTIVPSNNSTFLVPMGVLTIDFGTGCADNHGTVRKGIISIAYNGRRFLPGSSVVTTLDGYEINGVIVEGVRKVENSANSTQADPRFTTTMTGGKITWPDGTNATRDEVITREWKLAATAIENEWYVTGSAIGTNRKGSSYSMKIVDKLLYKKECAVNDRIYYAVQGTKELIISNNGKKITIDYGTGDCDRTVTVTINSKSKVVELGNN